MSDRYVVTEAAPARVAGRKVKPGDKLLLSPQEAEYERDLGYIEPLGASAPAEPDAEALAPAEPDALGE